MKTITIYGRSDDLIEVEGDIRDEWSGPGYLELSTGDVFHVGFNGLWNVEHVVKTGLVTAEIVRKEYEDDEGYTGHADVTGPITWVDAWSDWPPSETDLRERLGDRIDDLRGEALRAAYRAAMGHA